MEFSILTVFKAIDFFIYVFNKFININQYFFFHSIIKLLKSSNIISSFFLKLFGKNKWVKSVSLLLSNIKSINLIQKYQHTMVSAHYGIKCLYFSNVCTDICVSYISFGMHSTSNLSKYMILLPFTSKVANEFLCICTHTYLYIFPILYFRWDLFWINPIKFGFVLGT